MESYELNACVDRLNRLKKDVQYRQKKGLPFILASVIIWALILLSRIAAADLRTANLMTFICCCLLIPLATLFSKLLKADIFRKTGNPLNSLVVLATLNQLLYLLIAMWAFDRRPDAMLMIYAMIFGAHLLPYSWVHDSKAYLILSVIETVGALVIAHLLGSMATAAFILCGEIVLSVLLYKECKAF